MVQSIFVVKLHNILVLSFHHVAFHFQIVYCVKNLVFYVVTSNGPNKKNTGDPIEVGSLEKRSVSKIFGNIAARTGP